MKNKQEKLFEKTLQFYKEENLNQKDLNFYFYSPTDASEAKKFNRYEKPCDFWYFDNGFVAIECKYTASEKIMNKVIKQHQIDSLHHFHKNGSKSYLFLTMNLIPRQRISKSKTFALDINDYIIFKKAFKKSLFYEKYEDWNGIPIEYKTEFKIFNLDPILEKEYHLFGQNNE